MLKMAYEFGVRKAFEEAGILKESGVADGKALTALMTGVGAAGGALGGLPFGEPRKGAIVGSTTALGGLGGATLGALSQALLKEKYKKLSKLSPLVLGSLGAAGGAAAGVHAVE